MLDNMIIEFTRKLTFTKNKLISKRVEIAASMKLLKKYPEARKELLKQRAALNFEIKEFEEIIYKMENIKYAD